jgi:hypothetical protein
VGGGSVDNAVLGVWVTLGTFEPSPSVEVLTHGFRKTYRTKITNQLTEPNNNKVKMSIVYISGYMHILYYNVLVVHMC